MTSTVQYSQTVHKHLEGSLLTIQVVLSEDGTIVGFQPTSRVAVNQWVSNPLAVKLYKGRKLSPGRAQTLHYVNHMCRLSSHFTLSSTGLMEPILRITRPSKIVLIELLMSVNPGSWFALARPFK
jgi:hypothetical protein